MTPPAETPFFPDDPTGSHDLPATRPPAVGADLPSGARAGERDVDDDDPPDVFVESLQRHGAFRKAALSADQVADPRSLLALYVNGEDLSPDHGHPARVIVPAAPGVLNTKWVARMTFGDL